MFKTYAVSETSKINDWIEIAKTGKFPQGDLTHAVFDDIVSTFDPVKHEPPHTLGHIRSDHNDKPAYAWIEGVKRIGDTLFAKSKQVASELDSWVKDGRFKKRSIGIRVNAEGKNFLHHLAWLGSSVPAVQGLANVYEEKNFAYSDEGKDQKEFDYIEANNNSKNGVKKMEFTQEQLDDKIKVATIEAVKSAMKIANKDFTEKLTTETEKVKKETTDKLNSDFEEKQKADKLVANYKGDVEAMLKEFSEGEKIKIVPSQVSDIRQLLFSIGEVKAIEYSEKDKDGKDVDIKTDTLKLVKNIISNFKEVPKGEIKNVEEGTKGDDANFTEQDKAIKKLMKEDDKLSYREAMLQVDAEFNSK